MRNWNSQGTLLFWEKYTSIFSDSSWALEVWFSLLMVLLDCSLIQYHAVWISSLCTHWLEHNNSKRSLTKDHFRFFSGSNFKVFYVLTGPPEQWGQEIVSSPSPPPQKKSFLSMCPFFRRALEVPILKEVTNNVYEKLIFYASKLQ